MMMHKTVDSSSSNSGDPVAQEGISLESPSSSTSIKLADSQSTYEMTTRSVKPSPNSNANHVSALSLPTEQPQFTLILRRQRLPTDKTSLKGHSTIPSRFTNLSNAFEFARWGSSYKISLTRGDYEIGAAKIAEKRNERVLGQFLASALAGNAVLGSVFYAFPAVLAVGGVYSPISLLMATLILFIWRPVMEELGSALPMSGAPYTFLLNTSTRSIALVGASLLLLDFASTAVVSAATAAAYLAGEVQYLPFPSWLIAVLLLILFTVICLSGVKESSRVALTILCIHMGTVAVLILAAAVEWRRTGIDQLKSNWIEGQARTTSFAVILKQIYYGICLGMLGLTGFECVPSYIARIKPGKFPLVMRNLHLPTIFLNTFLMLLTLALVPLEKIQEGANVLSVLAEVSSGRWLRVCVVVDAMLVLSGGVLTGILSACELFVQLARDRVLPEAFLRSSRITGAPYISTISFAVFCGAIYASASARLDVVSQMFSLVWFIVMSLFPISLLLLKFNRGRLPRKTETRLRLLFLALAILPPVIAGNIALDPRAASYFFAYFFGILIFFLTTQNKVQILRCIYWLYDQCPAMHKKSLTQGWGSKLTTLMKRLQMQPLCILTKNGDIDYLFQMVSYVRRYEETSCLKIVHFYGNEEGVPSELEANVKILDEAFHRITIDLVLVQGEFTPESVAALAHHLNIPASLSFMSSPSRNFKHSVADFGTRIISA